MLRILFFVLAIVAVVLAFVLRLPELFIAAGILVVLAIGFLILQFLQRNQKPANVFTGRNLNREEELAEVGILGIRPKEKGGAVQAADFQEEEAESEPAPWLRQQEESHSVGDTHVVTAPLRIRKKNWTTDSEEGPVEVKLKKDVIIPSLQSLLSAVDASTACLLKQIEVPSKYRIEAIVSKNSYARTQGSFSTKTPLLVENSGHAMVSVVRVGEQGFFAENLNYYLEPIAVRQVAVMQVPQTRHRSQYLLLVDTMEEDGLNTDRQRTLITEYGHLLATLLDVGITGGKDENVSKLRPRREIVADEMRKARQSDHPLALALVHLRNAEAVAEKGRNAVREAERALEARLRNGVKDGRVERFGELTYGVFFNGSVSEVEYRAMALQTELASEVGLLEGGVVIGIAMMNDRHENAEEFRADATEALREAFETGSCTIIE